MVVLLNAQYPILMKYIQLSLLLLLVFSCSLSKKSTITLTYPSKNPISMQQGSAKIDPVGFEKEAAPLAIDSFQIEGATLRIYYTSSTALENFELVGSSNIAKSFPPIRACKILASPKPSNKASKNNDLQLELGILAFDIKPLANKMIAESPIYLQIEGIAEKILFVYPK
ncbi:MAG: hypothetical protein ACO29Z_08255 [Crocinitomicaceae bacterium]